MEASGMSARPYQAAVPSFGIWGFALARRSPFDPPKRVLPDLQFLDDQVLASLFVFPPDLAALPVEVNRLDNQVLVRYYESEWKRWE
jgi:spermidine synthase